MVDTLSFELEILFIDDINIITDEFIIIIISDKLKITTI